MSPLSPTREVVNLLIFKKSVTDKWRRRSLSIISDDASTYPKNVTLVTHFDPYIKAPKIG